MPIITLHVCWLTVFCARYTHNTNFTTNAKLNTSGYGNNYVIMEFSRILFIYTPSHVRRIYDVLCTAHMPLFGADWCF